MAIELLLLICLVAVAVSLFMVVVVIYKFDELVWRWLGYERRSGRGRRRDD